MVDIHSHILPGLDDGAESFEESLEMLQIAAASGTTDIVATPHANSRFRFDPVEVQKIFGRLSDLNTAPIALHLGCDFHINYENLCDAVENPTKYTINNNRHLMIELPDEFSSYVIKQAIDQLLRVGIIPVVTHPERNSALQRDVRELERWVKHGCLVQVTAHSLLGRFGQVARRVAHSLMRADLVHFIASDAHDCVDRTPDLSGAYKAVSKTYGGRRAEALFVDNPISTLRS